MYFDRAQLGNDIVASDGNVEFTSPKWAIDDRAVAIQQVRNTDQSVLLLRRGSVDAEQQIRLISFADPGSVHLVDWIR